MPFVTRIDPPAPRFFARLLPRPDERLAFVNLLLLLGLPLLAYGAFLFSQARSYDLYLPVHSEKPVVVRLGIDRGADLEMTTPAALHVPASPTEPVMARFDLPGGILKGLRVHLIHAPAAVVHLDAAQVVARDGDGTTIPVSLARLHGTSPQVVRVGPEGDGGARVELAGETSDPTCEMTLDAPLQLPFQTEDFVRDLAPALVGYALAALGALAGWRRLREREPVRRRVAGALAALEHCYGLTVRWCRAHPAAAIWLAAALSVAVSCYPIVFFGHTFVSPNNSGFLLYNKIPTLPGYADEHTDQTEGSDTGAAMVQCIPYSMIERQALLRDHELPLWNRYGAAGTSLIGQGQSMLGDPLQWMVILAGCNAGAWDLKYLLARLLFAAGVGLCVRAATGRLPAALLLAFSACFAGFFTFRFNHPAGFSLCYAPWMLYAWLEIARGDAPGGVRRTARFVGLLLLADWMELNSGTAKESSMLLLGINAAGLLVFLLSDTPARASKGRTFLGLLWAGGCFVLLTAPFWRTLLDMVTHSWSDYMEPRAWQLQPGLLIGLFDDLFYRQFNRGELLLDPAMNFVVLLGLAFAASSWKTLVRHRVFLALGLSTAVPFALVFGVISPSWIKVLPFLGHVTHVDNTFSCVLMVPLFVLAGFGLERCRERLRAADWTLDYAGAAAVLAALLVMFFGLAQAGQRSDYNPLGKIGEVPLSPFFRSYAFSLVAAFLALPLLARRLWRVGAPGAPGVLPWLVVCLGALLWRGGVQLPGVAPFERYLFHPPLRADLQAYSPVVARMQALTRAQPARCIGLGQNLSVGFTAYYGLESPSGPDALQNLFYHTLITDSGQDLVWHWRLMVNREQVIALRRFYDLLNLRYYVTGHLGRDHSPTPTEVPGLTPLGRYDLDLYESPTAWPRAFFTDTLVPSVSNANFYALLLQGDGRPFAAVPPGELTRPDAPTGLNALIQDDDAARTVAPATGYRLTNHTTTFRVHATRPGVAVLMESFQDDNARVTVNGQPAPHFRVDQAFSGVYLPAVGDYEIVYHYGPSDLGLLLGASALGALGLVAAAGWVWRRSRTVAPPVGRMVPVAHEETAVTS